MTTIRSCTVWKFGCVYASLSSPEVPGVFQGKRAVDQYIGGLVKRKVNARGSLLGKVEGSKMIPRAPCFLSPSLSFSLSRSL